MIPDVAPCLLDVSISKCLLTPLPCELSEVMIFQSWQRPMFSTLNCQRERHKDGCQTAFLADLYEPISVQNFFRMLNAHALFTCMQTKLISQYSSDYHHKLECLWKTRPLSTGSAFMG